MRVKDTFIRIRVTTEEKEIIKEVAREKGITMSELVLGATETIIKKHTEKTRIKKMIEDRATRTEKKLIKIIERIRSNKLKKSPSKFMFWVGRL